MGDRRGCLHRMLQSATEQDNTITDTLAQGFSESGNEQLSVFPCPVPISCVSKTLETGFSMGGFLCEAGSYPAATSVHRACLEILKRLNPSEPSYLFCKLEVLSKLLHSLSSYCCFSEATLLANEILDYLCSGLV